MAETKPEYRLIEHGRYFFQRRVPLHFQSAVGRKKWRAPSGNDHDAANDRLKVMRAERHQIQGHLEGEFNMVA